MAQLQRQLHLHSVGGPDDAHSPGVNFVVLVAAVEPGSAGPPDPAARVTKGDEGGLLLPVGEEPSGDKAIRSLHDAVATFAGTEESTARTILSNKMYCP